MRSALLIGLGLGLVSAACGDDNETPKDANLPGDDAAVIDAPPDAAPLPACATPVSGSTVTARRIGGVSGGAMLATAPPNDPRLFVVEQGGRIRIFENEVLLETPFLDLSADADGPVICCNENGLLGLAFHPQYATNGRFFIFYTSRDPSGQETQLDVLARCEVSAADANVADKTTCTDVLVIPDFATNHNGGMIEFGSDGYLYIGTGDGGGGGDPQRTAQNLDRLLGKMLRIDVDNPSGGNQYGIPADNPYANGGGRPEIFMRGLRNPWRWSFDRGTGDMWIGDVGQRQYEELDVLRPDQQKDANLGWSVYEGDTCCMDVAPDLCDQSSTSQAACVMDNKWFPQDVRTHGGDGWISIIGGDTYRGSCYPDLVGWHFYNDYGDGGLVKARLQTDGTLEIVNLPGTFPNNPASIHADARGELYITTTNGSVFHIEAGP